MDSNSHYNAEKARIQERFVNPGLYNNTLNIHQSNERIVVMGVLKNRRDIYAQGGERSTAAGTELNIGAIEANQETQVLSQQGQQVNIENPDVKSVYIRVHTLNEGDISAHASGPNAEANATAIPINIYGNAKMVDVQNQVINRGNISAKAEGVTGAEANATVSRLRIQSKNPLTIHVNEQITDYGNNTAYATGGGVAASLYKAGELSNNVRRQRNKLITVK